MTGTSNALVLGPFVAPLAGAAVCLLLARYNRAQRVVALGAGLVAWVCSVAVLLANLAPARPGVQVYHLGGWLPPFGIVFVADLLAALFCVMATTVVLAGLLQCLTSHEQSLRYPVFMPAFLCMSAGLAGSFYTGDIFTLFVFIELMVMASVVMVAVADNPLGLEAAIKYLFISGMGSLLLLLGIAAIYTTFGTLNMAEISAEYLTGARPLLTVPASIMINSAFLIKSAVFPFHFWQPDFHTTAPTAVSGMLSSVVVKVGIYGIIRNNTGYMTQEVEVIQAILIVLGIVGIFYGSLSALRTWNVKRLLAYSTLAQIGFVLVALGWGSQLALVAAVIYIVNHAAIKSGLLMLTGTLASHNERHSADLADLQGAGRGRPVLSVLFLVGGLALAGVPPFNGFISKVALVRGGADVGSWVTLGLVVGGGLLTLLYMARTWQWIFQRPAPEPAVAPSAHADSPLAPALLITACVALGVFAAPLVSTAEATIRQATDPTAYICAVLPDPSAVGQAGVECPQTLARGQ
ncbi:MAG TPA: proton-conducting transporter membrane subunit [Euzebyales bacterium]|nr:proton-conducting transporter membrane subunit [Euzebyales bacterium]